MNQQINFHVTEAAPPPLQPRHSLVPRPLKRSGYEASQDIAALQRAHDKGIRKQSKDEQHEGHNSQASSAFWRTGDSTVTGAIRHCNMAAV